jgi:protoporphyrinogen/coproporphyrinogen III oxidase
VTKLVVVVGAGISGMVAAYRLTRTHNGEGPLDVLVLEATDQAGGKLRTIRLDGIRVEAGADSFVVRKPWAVELCKELGLGGELIRPGAEDAFVWAGGRMVPFPQPAAFGIPTTAGGMLRWPGLPLRSRIRAAADLYRGLTGETGDQSLGSLIRHRMGPKALHVLVGPLLAGIHAGDPDRMSLLATFPELRTWERGHDSLIRGARAAWKASTKGDRTPLFASLWGGLSGLTAALERALGEDSVWLGCPVERIERAGSGYRVHARGEPLTADAVVLAVPAFEASRALAAVSAAAAAELAAIPYGSTAAVFLVYPKGELPDGTGFVVPLGERTMTACTFLSAKWPREEHAGRVILRCFVGSAGRERDLECSDDDLVQAVAGEAEQALELTGPPSAWRVVRWPRAMPQYEVGHLERVERIDDALAATPGLFVTGSAYRGVGIADCVRQGDEAAQRVLSHLRGDRSAEPVNKRETISWTT